MRFILIFTAAGQNFLWNIWYPLPNLFTVSVAAGAYFLFYMDEMPELLSEAQQMIADV